MPRQRKIIAYKQRAPMATSRVPTTWVREIDQLLYKLYGLTEE